jgi:hypothetical protein
LRSTIAFLDFDRAADRVDDAAKLDQSAVAGALDDASVMGGDRGVDEVASQTPKTSERAILVGARQPAVSDHVGNKNRREFPHLAHCAPSAAVTLPQMPAQSAQTH